MFSRQQTLASFAPICGPLFMKEFLLSTPAQAVIWIAALSILIAVGGYIMGSFRGRDDEDRQSANRLLTNFRESHHQGDINDSEFRTIKTVLGAELQQELSDRDDEG
jgi:uncharacterized membrane protein